MDLNLLEKTEIRIDGAILAEETNLTALAAVVAGILELPSDKVMVIDVRPTQVALDILLPSVRAEAVFGKKGALLAALGAIPGLTLTADADIHSEGILGAIALSPDDAAAALTASRAMGQAIAASRRARIRVFPTGFELVERRIEDTNTPYLIKVFAEAGYLPEAGPAVPDSRQKLVDALAPAAEDCGLVVTTGGVGAEDKDYSVEAIQTLDPGAATPYLVRFTKGDGRHVKDGVRLAVGELSGCLLVALPGPHDEVRLAAPIVIQGLKQGWSKEELALRLAERLREKFRAAGSGQEQHPSEHRHGHKTGHPS